MLILAMFGEIPQLTNVEELARNGGCQPKELELIRVEKKEKPNAVQAWEEEKGKSIDTPAYLRKGIKILSR